MAIPSPEDLRNLFAAMERLTPLSQEPNIGVSRTQALKWWTDATESREALLDAISKCRSLEELEAAFGRKPEPETSVTTNPIRGRDIATGRAASNTATTQVTRMSVGRAAKRGFRAFRPTELEATGGY